MVSFEDLDGSNLKELEHDPEPNYGPIIVSEKYTFQSPSGYDNDNNSLPPERTVKSLGATKTGQVIELQGGGMSPTDFFYFQDISLAATPQIYRNSLCSQVYQVYIDIRQIPISGTGQAMNYTMSLTIIQEGE